MYFVWVYACNGDSFVHETLWQKREAVYGTIAAVLGSLLGFVIAGMAIVIGQARHLQFLKEANQLQNLFTVFRLAIYALGIGTSATIIALIIDGDSVSRLWIPGVVLWVTLLATARVWRAIWILKKIVKSLS